MKYIVRSTFRNGDNGTVAPGDTVELSDSRAGVLQRAGKIGGVVKDTMPTSIEKETKEVGEMTVAELKDYAKQFHCIDDLVESTKDFLELDKAPVKAELLEYIEYLDAEKAGENK